MLQFEWILCLCLRHRQFHRVILQRVAQITWCVLCHLLHNARIHIWILLRLSRTNQLKSTSSCQTIFVACVDFVRGWWCNCPKLATTSHLRCFMCLPNALFDTRQNLLLLNLTLRVFECPHRVVLLELSLSHGNLLFNFMALSVDVLMFILHFSNEISTFT